MTTDFSRLSARERTRIARQEAEEAARDGAFQALMAHADELFRQQRYEDALERYQEARRMRPYNVYPPVKIQDLQALIARREAERSPEPPPLPAPAPLQVSDGPVGDDRPDAHQDEVVPVPVPIPATQSTTPPAGREPSSPAVPTDRVPLQGPRRPAPDRPSVHAAPLHQAEATERTYREGRAIVLERWRMEEGRAVEYRKVAHPWGEVVHFRDGRAISARAWEEAFADQTATSRTGISSRAR